MLMRSQKKFVYLIVLTLLVLLVAVGGFFVMDFAPTVLMAILVVYCLLVVVLYYLSVYRGLGPIVSQVEALLAGARYQKLPVKTKDEFGVLGTFFNQVTDDLEAVAHDLEEGDRRASELSLAAEIQKSILPKETPEIAGLEIVARTRPAEEVGGDSFGFIEQGLQHYIYLGDVTGHGAPAGLIMMMVNTLFAVFAPEAESSKDLMVRTNAVLKPRVNSTMFMTTVLLRWDIEQRKFYYTGAGHEHILIYRAAEGVCEAVVTGGIALGMVEEMQEIAQEKELNLQVDDIVVLYTDGIPEARNYTEEMFGLDRLKQAVQQFGVTKNAEQVFNGIAETFGQFVGEEPQLDDITLIVMRNLGQEKQQAKDEMQHTRWEVLQK